MTAQNIILPDLNAPFYKDEKHYKKDLGNKNGYHLNRDAKMIEIGIADLLGGFYSGDAPDDKIENIDLEYDFKSINVILKDSIKFENNISNTVYEYEDINNKKIKVSIITETEEISAREFLLELKIEGINFKLSKEEKKEIERFIRETEEWHFDRYKKEEYIADDIFPFFDECHGYEMVNINGNDVIVMLESDGFYIDKKNLNVVKDEDFDKHENDDDIIIANFNAGIMKKGNEFYEIYFFHSRHYTTDEQFQGFSILEIIKENPIDVKKM